MKKNILVGLLLIIPFLTACGSSNKLVCTRSSDGATREITVAFDSKKEKATGAMVLFTMDFSDEAIIEEYGCADLEECMTRAEAELEDCEKDKEFESCKIAKKTKTSVSIQGKMKKESVEEELKGKNYDDVKKMMEEDNYTCK